MLELRRIRLEPEELARKIARKGVERPLERILDLDQKRRSVLTELEELRHQRNVLSEQVSVRKRSGQDASDIMEQVRGQGERMKGLDAQVAELDAAIQEELAGIPNAPSDDVPDGGEDDNVEVRRHGEIPSFAFEPKPHYEIGEALGMMDFTRASRVAGTRFVFLKGIGARLERALVDFFLDVHRERGYEEMMPPYIVTPEAAFGTANLPKFEEDMFKLTDGRYLIPTAEVPVTNYHRDEVLAEEDLPLRYCAFSPCFRSEAGSAGRDTRGIIRLHQFNKVELVRFTTAERSYDELEMLTRDAEEVLRRLEIPYRVMLMAVGDLGFAQAKKYDIEVWLPSFKTYREISSCSLFEDYQARRANIRYRPKDGGRLQFAHTLNGSGVAIGRAMAAILENYQEADGRVRVPTALRPYLGGCTHLE